MCVHINISMFKYICIFLHVRVDGPAARQCQCRARDWAVQKGVYRRTFVHICMNEHVYVNICVYIYIHICVYVYTHMFSTVQVQNGTYVFTFVYIYLNIIYIYIYVCIHIYIYYIHVCI